LLEKRTRKFVNETDFDASPDDQNAAGEVKFKQFMNQYIHYRYEPAVEEFEEARYFTKNFNESLIFKMNWYYVRPHKVNSITFKK
jgi:hypothetical protein